MERRKFLTGAALARARRIGCTRSFTGTRTMTIVSTWPRDFPGLGTSAQRFAQRVVEIVKRCDSNRIFRSWRTCWRV
jgi:hypothetical protein